ncbi:NAD-dependent epimerase/dehydratase family protein [Dietzia sp.]|uniref:NAD-dependent epimerase/dehydratase family protein n=1 Tax=Dietzia sp. TaxID=1871616 RepID=UPI002FDA37EB
MRHLVIGEGQIGQGVIAAALGRGDSITVLRRSAVTHEEDRARYGAMAERITRVAGGVGDAAALREALAGGAPGTGGADGAEPVGVVHACFHSSAYDARWWEEELPEMERATLDAAAAAGVPVAFPESMYGFVGGAADLREGAEFSPRDAKGEMRVRLIEARRAHAARTVSVVASDLIGPSCLSTGSAVACTTVIEPLAAGRRAFVPGSPRREHSLTTIGDMAAAMLLAAEHAEDLANRPETGGTDAVVHAPTDASRQLAELVAFAAERLGSRRRTPFALPRFALRAAGLADRTMREIDGIGDLWYGDCRLRPGVLTTHYGLAPTPWDTAVAETVDAAAADRAAARSPRAAA